MPRNTRCNLWGLPASQMYILLVVSSGSCIICHNFYCLFCKSIVSWSNLLLQMLWNITLYLVWLQLKVDKAKKMEICGTWDTEFGNVGHTLFWSSFEHSCWKFQSGYSLIGHFPFILAWMQWYLGSLRHSDMLVGRNAELFRLAGSNLNDRPMLTFLVWRRRKGTPSQFRAFEVLLHARQVHELTHCSLR